MNTTEHKFRNPQNCSDVVQRIHISDEAYVFANDVSLNAWLDVRDTKPHLLTWHVQTERRTKYTNIARHGR